MQILQDILKANPVSSMFNDLGDLLTGFYNLAFYLAMALSFIWLVWGVFEYLLAAGDKQKLASARARITWALVGLLIVAIAFAIAKFAEEILQPRGGSPLLGPI